LDQLQTKDAILEMFLALISGDLQPRLRPWHLTPKRIGSKNYVGPCLGSGDNEENTSPCVAIKPPKIVLTRRLPVPDFIFLWVNLSLTLKVPLALTRSL
jgi:hypothetical protein